MPELCRVGVLARARLINYSNLTVGKTNINIVVNLTS